MIPVRGFYFYKIGHEIHALASIKSVPGNGLAAMSPDPSNATDYIIGYQILIDAETALISLAADNLLALKSSREKLNFLLELVQQTKREVAEQTDLDFLRSQSATRIPASLLDFESAFEAEVGSMGFFWQVKKVPSTH